MTHFEDDDFDPTNLESLMVARPLLEMMAMLEDQRTHPEKYKGKPQLPDPIPVVIDLNFAFSEGLAQAKDNLLAMLEARGIPKGAHDGESILWRKTKLSTQHVFAKLDPDTIRWLGGQMQNDGDARKGAKRARQREVFMIWPDFALESHIHRSVATIKANAARTSFQAEGKGIVWAVVDSGIAGDHWHFKRHGNLDLDDSDPAIRHMDFTKDWAPLEDLSAADKAKQIQMEAAEALTDSFGHGSHVAGIIAGEYVTDPKTGWSKGGMPKSGIAFAREAKVYRKRRTEGDREAHTAASEAHLSGMAPLAKLVSFKVLNDDGGGEVSNVIAALAQIQIINEYGRHLRIHGVNLSVGYPFNPEWFACGQSPLCVEVERLVKSGVVVVVSAGNSGYGTKQTLMTRKVRAGMMMTINDPGNAERAITVGSTHGEKPHEFGPSYFSSKGPTGDGRLKPDLLAPGERIISCGAGRSVATLDDVKDRNDVYVDQSGTSMAAPHVSGAIAAFLSIRREFIGRPERVKEVVLASTTDLGRDRNMQGAGLLDLMRAIQSV